MALANLFRRGKTSQFQEIEEYRDLLETPTQFEDGFNLKTIVGALFVSIVMVVAYHKINQYGEDFAALGRADPALALWGPFAVFAALILWMFYRVAYVPGGQAIGALETGSAKLSKQIRKLFRRKRRRFEADPDSGLTPQAAE